MLPSLAGLPDLWRSIERGRHFHLRTVAREPRQAAVARAEAAVQARRGDVLDFKQFSDLSLNLLVELEVAGLLSIADELAALGWPVDLDPPRELLATQPAARLEGTFQLTFPDGEGELAIPQPRVPG